MSDAQGAMSPRQKSLAIACSESVVIPSDHRREALISAKKQVDLLTAVDKKMEVIANAARDGGLLFP